MGESVAYIGVASNLDPERHIPAALEELSKRLRLLATSTFYQTVPLADRDQPDYRNGVVKIEVSAPPAALKFDFLRVIEARLGRRRTTDRHAARTIDLDVLIYGNEVVEEEDLSIPDPDIRKRAFVAVPLLELAPGLILPDTGEALAELASVQSREALKPDARLTSVLKARFGHE